MRQSTFSRKFISTPARWLLDIVLPPTCALCQINLARGEDLGLCPTCWKGLPRWQTRTEPMPRLPLHLNSFQAPFLYEEDIREMVLQLKFADKTELAQVLAPFMVGVLPTLENPLLMPIPLHSKRLQKRLFNQAALLVQAVARQTGLEMDLTALTKTVHTTPQAQKSAKGRTNLAHNVFTVTGDVTGRDIILVDDIYTTGSTLNAAAGRLKKAGAASVHAVTVAYTAP